MRENISKIGVYLINLKEKPFLTTFFVEKSLLIKTVLNYFFKCFYRKNESNPI